MNVEILPSFSSKVLSSAKKATFLVLFVKYFHTMAVLRKDYFVLSTNFFRPIGLEYEYFM